MADIYEKTLQTRIQLKYDTYANWIGSSLKLKKGEAAICELQNNVNPIQNAPTILVKYGDGEHTFSQLPWSSALAADVFAWAKESGLYIEEIAANPLHSSDDTTIKVFNAVEWKKTTAHPNGALVFTYDNAATLESIEAQKDAYNLKLIECNHRDNALDIALYKNGELSDTNRIHLIEGEGIFLGAALDNESGSKLTISNTKDYTGNLNTITNGFSFDIRDEKENLKGSTLSVEGGDNVTISADSDMDMFTIHANDTITTVSSSDALITVTPGNPATVDHDTTTDYAVGIDRAELTKLIGETTTAAMEFKGVVSSALPTGTIKTGDMWKIGYPGFTITPDQSAEGLEHTVVVGDAIVADIQGGDVYWYVIPAGDDVEDTWRPIHVGSYDLTQKQSIIFNSDKTGAGKVNFYLDDIFEDSVEICAEVNIPNLTVTEESSKASADENGLITVVASVREDPQYNAGEQDKTTTHGILYKNIENVATSTYVDKKVKDVSDKIDNLDATVTATNAAPGTYTVKNAAGTTQTVTAPVFGTGVTQTDGKLTAMAGAQVTTDDILQGQYVLVFDCGGAN